jgi:hypothetical protein
MVAQFGIRRHLIDGAVVVLLAASSLLGIIWFGFAAHDPMNGVAVVFAPWTDAQTAMALATGAGARFVRYGSFPFIIVVIPDSIDYPSSAAKAGALFLADPQKLAACLPDFANYR